MLRIFSLVESSICPSTREGFKQDLKEGRSVDTEFIGVLVEECQEWTQEHSQHNFISKDILAIIDERSTRDETISLYQYIPERKDPQILVTGARSRKNGMLSMNFVFIYEHAA